MIAYDKYCMWMFITFRSGLFHQGSSFSIQSKSGKIVAPLVTPAYSDTPVCIKKFLQCQCCLIQTKNYPENIE